MLKFAKTYSNWRLDKLTGKGINAMSLRNDGRSLINQLRSSMAVCGLPYTPGRIRSIIYITRYIHYLASTMGVRGVTLYLKGCSVYLQQAIGKHVVHESTAFGPAIARSKDGIPRIIPALHRVMIRRGDVRYIKFYLSVFNLYRLFDWVGPVKLTSITDRSSGTNTIDLSEFIIPFFRALPITPQQFYTDLMTRYKELRLFDLFKSGPQTTDIVNINTHPVTVAGSARMLQSNKVLYDSISYFVALGPKRMGESFHWLANNIPRHVGSHSHEWYQLEGKVGLKQEAAGKIRVFAMVDS